MATRRDSKGRFTKSRGTKKRGKARGSKRKRGHVYHAKETVNVRPGTRALLVQIGARSTRGGHLMGSRTRKASKRRGSKTRRKSRGAG